MRRFCRKFKFFFNILCKLMKCFKFNEIFTTEDELFKSTISYILYIYIKYNNN